MTIQRGEPRKRRAEKTLGVVMERPFSQDGTVDFKLTWFQVAEEVLKIPVLQNGEFVVSQMSHVFLPTWDGGPNVLFFYGGSDCSKAVQK